MENTGLNLTAYLIYLPVVLVLTWYVARTLFINGRVFMMDIFSNREEIAMATNKLFEIGFYLLNIGFAFWIMEISASIYGYQHLMEVLSLKLGGYSIYLGIMLFFNLYMFFRGRRASKRKQAFNTSVIKPGEGQA